MDDNDKILRTDVAHSARVYDYWLGGKDNFAPDRTLADSIQKVVPAVPLMVRANRVFVHRAVRYLTGRRIRQFLDIGTGIPTRPNLHEVAQSIIPDARVVYVDNDPLVLAHARALLTSTPQGRCDYLEADLRRPDVLLRSRQVAGMFDFTEPVAVTFGSILMLLADQDDPWAIVQHIMAALPPGSFLVVSHPAGDMNPDAMDKVAAASTAAGLTFVPRDRAAVARFVAGYQLVDPGLVPVLAWRPDSSTPQDPHTAYYWVAVART
jgi:SAM-dependent methyltransferase